MALVAQYELELNHFDVKATFLYGDLDEIFMTLPTGFKTTKKENSVCKLKRLLYGLK